MKNTEGFMTQLTACGTTGLQLVSTGLLQGRG